MTETYYENKYREYINFLVEEHEKLQKTNKWNKVFKALDMLSIHPDYELDDYRSSASNDNTLSLYARHTSTPRPSEKEFLFQEFTHTPFSLLHASSPVIQKYGLDTWDIFDDEEEKPKVEVNPHFPPNIDPFQVIYLENTPEAIWQALLLYMTHNFTGQRWHGGYSRRKLLFKNSDIPVKTSNQSEWNLRRNGVVPDFPDRIFIPKVILGYGRREINMIRFCVWSNWGGLSVVKVPFDYSYANRTISFGKFTYENLYKYDCGIRF